MSDTSSFGFGKFVPGFDFLQNLAKGASQNIPQLPNLSHWVAPTINVEELEKRIEELKAVQFWLEQNSRALAATIQALEVQKMTLATLKGMNFSMGDVANAFKLKTADAVIGGVHKAADTVSSAAEAVAGVASRVTGMGQTEAEPEAAPAKKTTATKSRTAAKAEPAQVVDPMQWWGSLTSQFQQIAASAMKDAARQTAIDTTRNMATGLAKEALKTATGMASQFAGKAVAKAAKAPKAAASAKPAAKAPAAPRKKAASSTPRKAAAPRRRTSG